MVDEKLVNIRLVAGINQSNDARISDPGSYLITQNLWSKNTTGLLAKRPGTSLVVDGRAVQSTSAPSTGPTGGIQVGGGISTNTTILVVSNTATIPVTSTNGFPSSGTVWLDCDTGNVVGGTPISIPYTGITATSFTGCTGAAGNTAQNGAAVTSPVNAGIAVNPNVIASLLTTGITTTVAGSGGSIVSTAAINTVTAGVTSPALTGTHGIVPRINL